MKTSIASKPRRFGASLAAMVVLFGGAVITSAAPPPAGPATAGAARIWFYRDYEPYVSRNYANVALNGAPAVSLSPYDGYQYRDVPAGHYHISVDSFGVDVNQSKDVDLAPGQEAYVKILSQPSWTETGDMMSFQRDTYYVALVSPQVARAEMGRTR